jgi:long-chain fatty acid transport protein
MRLTIRFRAAVLLAGVLAAGPAWAGGFYSALFGGELGHPTTDDLSAIYFNPAGLSLARGTRLQLNGVVGYRAATYDRPAAAIDHPGSGTPNDAIAANSGRASMLNLQALPFAALATDFGVKNLAVAVGFYVPFGGILSWHKNNAFRDSSAYPGAVDGPARWAMIDGDLRSYYLTAAASYTIERAGLSLGVAANLVYNTLSTLRARDANGSDDLVASTGDIVEGRTQIDVSNLTGSIAVGAIFHPQPNWWAGISYQSQPGFGKVTMTGTLRNKFGTGADNVQAVDFEQAYPDILRGGVRVRPVETVELRLFADWQRWSVFDRQCLLDASNPQRKCALTRTGAIDTANGGQGVILALPRNWSDGVGLRVGTSWFVRPWLELMIGAGYDSNVVPDSTMDPSLMDQDKFSAALGARLAMLKNRLMLTANWMQIIYVPRDVAPQARDATGDRLAPQPPSRSPDGAGHYTESTGLFSLAAEYRFR